MSPQDTVIPDGPKILALRKAKGLSRPKLAAMLPNGPGGTPRHFKTIHSIETNRFNTTYGLLCALAAALGVTPEEIAAGDATRQHP